MTGEYVPLRYRRDVLVSTLVYHQQTNTSGCHCGWGRRPEHLGRSWAEHVAGVYELAAAHEHHPQHHAFHPQPGCRTCVCGEVEAHPWHEHEHVYAEEQEPNGRLVLPPCLVCGLSAMDALAVLSARSECSDG